MRSFYLVNSSWRAIRRFDQGVSRNAFPYPVTGNEGALAEGRAGLKEGHVLDVELASERARLWEIAQDLASARALLALLKENG